MKPIERAAARSGRTTARIAVNCTPAQKAAIMEKADATGLSPTAICLAMHAGCAPARPSPEPHGQRAGADGLSCGATAKLKDALKESLAELGKSGSNLNQIAYMLNAKTAPPAL